MTETFVTSDEHWEHDKINEYAGRPFASLAEMNLALLRNWNAVVGEDDDVLIVGDIVMGQRKNSLLLVELLHGNKFLISGNHDHCHEMYQDSRHYVDHVKLYEDAGLTILPPQIVCTFTDGVFGWAETLDDLNIRADDFVFRVCHFPYSGDSHKDDRYPEWRPIDDGLPLLHGHTHSKVAYRGHQVDVGVDAQNFTPQPLSKILAGFNYTED